MGVNIKQAKYCGGDPPVPTTGSPQPLLDTSNNSGVGPGVNIKQATYSGFPGNPSMAFDMPTGASIPTDSTDVQNPESHGSDQTPKDIFRSPATNG